MIRFYYQLAITFLSVGKSVKCTHSTANETTESIGMLFSGGQIQSLAFRMLDSACLSHTFHFVLCFYDGDRYIRINPMRSRK